MYVCKFVKNCMNFLRFFIIYFKIIMINENDLYITIFDKIINTHEIFKALLTPQKMFFK